MRSFGAFTFLNTSCFFVLPSDTIVQAKDSGGFDLNETSADAVLTFHQCDLRLLVALSALALLELLIGPL